MRTTLGATAAVFAVAIAAAGSSAAPRNCSGGSQTLAANSVARVYRQQDSVIGCTRGHRTTLGSSVGRLRIGQLALTGHYVAFAVNAMGVDTSSAEVRVADLLSGHLRHVEAAAPLGRPESFVSVASIVVDARGRAAWIARRSAIAAQPDYEVRKLTGGASALLDRSAAVDPGSLRRRGETLSWVDAGARRRATLS